jgi:hypothetical protein
MASVKDNKAPALPQIMQNIFDAHFPIFEKEDKPRGECRNKPKKERDNA